MTSTKQDRCLTIFYDGKCEMCAFIKEKLTTSKQKDTFVFKDIANTPSNQFTSDALQKEIHVVDENGRIFKNAEAILKILEKYPQYRLLATIGRLPIIKHLLPLGYKWVAMNRKFFFGKLSRIYWLKIIVSTAFIVGLALSAKLWISTRLYPKTPLLPFLPEIQAPFDYLVLGSLFLLLILILLLLHVRKYIVSFLILLTGLLLLDQSRLQPWAYQYALMLFTLLFFSWDVKDAQKGESILNTNRFIVAMIYVWSGLHKFNVFFIFDTFPWLNSSLVKLSSSFSFANQFALIVPSVEVLIGVGLLTKKFRDMAVVTAVLMHGYILLALGPLGHNWNSVIWPWNIAMMAFVILLFWGNQHTFSSLIFQRKFVPHYAIILLIGILPALSFFNKWDHYLSFALYSADTKSAQVYLTKEAKTKMPQQLQQYIHKTKSSPTYILSLQRWSMGEMNVPTYPEVRIYKNTFTHLCEYLDDSKGMYLSVRQNITYFDKNWRNQYYYCGQKGSTIGALR